MNGSNIWLRFTIRNSNIIIYACFVILDFTFRKKNRDFAPVNYETFIMV